MDHVDLTDRQRELADAALAIVAREGMAAVTFRSVAAESGWSLGAVQKAFAAKDDMYAAMFARLRTAEGLGPTRPPGEPTVHDWLTELVVSILPLDERRRDLTLQGQAFADRAAFDQAVGRTIAAGDTELRGLLSHLVTRGQHGGEIPTETDPTTAAWAVLALAQGLAAQLLYDPVPTRTIRRRVRVTVASILGLPAPD